MSIVKELQEHHKSHNSIIESYRKLLKEALVENLVPYLRKSEKILTRVAKDQSINGKNSIYIFLNISNYPDDGLISWHIDLSHQLIGSLSLNSCIDDYIYSNRFFIFKKQIKCRDINYKSLLRKMNAHNISIGTWSLLESITEESPSVLDNVKNYYESLGFEVRLKRDRDVIRLILNWPLVMDRKT